MAGYKIAAPNEYLAITGAGIKDVKICRESWVWPFQNCQVFSIEPRGYALRLQAISSDMCQFTISVDFIIGPDVNLRVAKADRQAHRVRAEGSHSQGDALVRYAILLAGHDGKKGPSGASLQLENNIKAIIDAEIRVLASSTCKEEVYSKKDKFEHRISRKVQGRLDEFSLNVYHVNVKEVKDTCRWGLFQSLRKAWKGDSNQRGSAARGNEVPVEVEINEHQGQCKKPRWAVWIARVGSFAAIAAPVTCAAFAVLTNRGVSL